HGPSRRFMSVTGTCRSVTPSRRRSKAAATPTNTQSVSTCADSMSGYMKTDSCRAMLPGVSASHWQNGRRDMGSAYYTDMRKGMRLAGLALLAALPAGAQTAAQPVRTMTDLMAEIIYPSSDAISYIATRTPTHEAQ